MASMDVDTNTNNAASAPTATSTAADVVNIAVIIPSWSAERALKTIQSMVFNENRPNSATYIVVGQPEPANLGRHVHTVWIDQPYPLSPVEAMAVGANKAIELADRKPDVLVFVHDDVAILYGTPGFGGYGWDDEIVTLFKSNRRFGLAGFGGGVGFAHPDIYKLPYDYRQLARYDFVSNMLEAEHHGRRVTEPMRVAALDGFALITTMDFYMRAGRSSSLQGAWDMCLDDGIQFHMYDAWLSCRAAEMGYETWMLPVRCHHAGGSTSVGMADRYAEVTRRLGYAAPEELYDRAHRIIYERFRHVLPIRVNM